MNEGHSVLAPSKEELEKAGCWEAVDEVPGHPTVTAFKRAARLHQARWRETKGLKIGSNAGRAAPSWIDLKRSLEPDLPNFLGEPVRNAVLFRLAHSEKGQQLDQDRLACNLLSSMPMAFNLFGWLFNAPALADTALADTALADTALRGWWPETAERGGRNAKVRFEWSPGRGDRAYLGNHSAFDVALTFDLGTGAGVVGIETKYHEHAKPEQAPSDDRLIRYREVAEASRAFKPGAIAQIVGSDMQQIWQDHLLALSMLQHPLGTWRWAKFVLVHPATNPSFQEAGRRYHDLLADDSTFELRTIESLLGDGMIPPESVAAFRQRYLW